MLCEVITPVEPCSVMCLVLHCALIALQLFFLFNKVMFCVHHLHRRLDFIYDNLYNASYLPYAFLQICQLFPSDMEISLFLTNFRILLVKIPTLKYFAVVLIAW